jgi:Cu(I)/Ag(I) efflux system protein CusF
MKTLTLALGMTIAVTSGMVHAAATEHDMPQHQVAMQAAASPAKHEGVGMLKAVNEKAGKVQIAHEAIADLGWPPMTMWFVVRDPLPRDIRAGDAVRFELMEGEKKQWVIVKIGRK